MKTCRVEGGGGEGKGRREKGRMEGGREGNDEIEHKRLCFVLLCVYLTGLAVSLLAEW